jgi:hypothetical protein
MKTQGKRIKECEVSRYLGGHLLVLLRDLTAQSRGLWREESWSVGREKKPKLQKRDKDATSTEKRAKERESEGGNANKRVIIISET